MASYKKKFVFVFLALLFSAFVFLLGCFWNKIPFLLPHYAKEYSVLPLSCNYLEKTCTKINFDFSSSKKARHQIPEYSIQEFPNLGETKIIFQNINQVTAQFTYNEIIENPLIEDLHYFQENSNFVVVIKRKGPFLPAKILESGSVATIMLPENGENFPSFSNQQPANNSSVYPALQMIRIKVTLQSPLKTATLYFQGLPVEFSTSEIAENQYFLFFNKKLAADETYKVRAIVTDQQGQAEISVWEFDARFPAKKEYLDANRFKYLGWWGEINTNGISVRKGPSTQTERLGTFSTANRVKVLNEVYGEAIDGNQVWYEIDGGKYPGAYVFSEFITSIEQPEPPQNFEIPGEVKAGEYWVDIDLTKKVLTLFSYDLPVFATYVAPGRTNYPTVSGTYRIWAKLRKDDMAGGPPDYDTSYDLTDIPSVLYYKGGYAIHGTYWHDKFGTLQSHGCTNMTQGDAEYVFDKLNPILEPGQESVISSSKNPGAIVHNHY
ncbi:MAG: L,D-transpeptidase family protein [Candidatus Pacebacteria bacterium]|nr:L,D-transpeptidase family protein [Candidatus Paceibacterota bacterium]